MRTMNKVATYSKRFKQLEFWSERNVMEYRFCESMRQARAILKNVKVGQRLISI